MYYPNPVSYSIANRVKRISQYQKNTHLRVFPYFYIVTNFANVKNH